MPLLLFILMLFLSSCGGNCSEIPSSFSSYEDAQSEIPSYNFNYTSSFSSDESSWIEGAKYFSCDGNSGYMILETNTRNYIHAQVPKEEWEAFRDAPSKGSFYNARLKGAYRFNLGN